MAESEVWLVSACASSISISLSLLIPSGVATFLLNSSYFGTLVVEIATFNDARIGGVGFGRYWRFLSALSGVLRWMSRKKRSTR
ncbi:hypothetical protein AYI69_g11035 [Smittium culicis]|uniref:Uncharacterized protein n=1 Tax=Smittium culicis TaxID=133412 RepID=A0A1R1X1K9_9FUNG|nr:hypothetical protein AYI69_g11035 [Smittium culicis]